MGDTVVVKAHNRLTFTSKWDPQYEVFDVRGPVVWLRNQKTGKTKVLDKRRVVLVDPDILWDDVQARPRCATRRSTTLVYNEIERDLDDNDVQEETVHFNPVATPLDECECFNLHPSATIPSGHYMLEQRRNLVWYNVTT